MGLSVSAKGLDKTYDCGYITFHNFRLQLAKAYNEELGVLYEKWFSREGLTEKECERFDEICPKGLDLFLSHSDCDGKFTPKECKMVYDCIKDLKMDLQGHNYGIVRFPNGTKGMETYNMLERWQYMFKHCYQRRVNMYFY